MTAFFLCAELDKKKKKSQHVLFFTSSLKSGPSENLAATEKAEKREGGERHSGEYGVKWFFKKSVLSVDRSS